MLTRKHRHKMAPVAVCPQTRPIQMPFSATANATVVLFRCQDIHDPECVQARILPGTWTMHDIGEVPADWPAELREPEVTHHDVAAVAAEDKHYGENA